MFSKSRYFTCVLMILLPWFLVAQSNYQVIDTGQDQCFNDSIEISPPNPGEPFFGQDAQYNGTQFSFQDNGDGTVTDLNTGMMWQQTPDLDNKSTWAEAVAGADTFILVGYDDWRLPHIKELYSLIDFRGSSMDTIPYIDTTFFDFEWGDTTQGERLIDAQYWSSTEYVGLTMNGDATAFGVNFADGRIKGYPTETGPGGQPFEAFVRYVRAGNNYGVNNYFDNGDGTISDSSTGLMWQQIDDGVTRNWEETLAYAENMTLAGYDNWRLPNAKELQSIVDYTRAPDAQNPGQQGPAIDTIFDVTEEESFFWTSTTLLEAPPDAGTGSEGVYIAFGQAWGYMGPPGNGEWLNVHGAGAQRSDPKSGDPGNYPYGGGPQGDEVRIFNYVRCVRRGLTNINEGKSESLRSSMICQNTPNPFRSETIIGFQLSEPDHVRITLYNTVGQKIKTILDDNKPAGFHTVIFEANNLANGVYYYCLETSKEKQFRKTVHCEEY